MNNKSTRAFLVAILIILAMDGVLFWKVFPYLQDKVASGWSPIYGQSTASQNGMILIFVDVVLFIVLFRWFEKRNQGSK